MALANVTAVVASLLLVLNVQPQRGNEASGISGYVLGPDGAPVSGGTAIGQAGFLSTTVPIDSTGRFRMFPQRPGVHELLISAPALAPYRMLVTVPDSKSLRLPVIRLDGGVYFRVRLVTPAGEPILAPQLRRQLYDASGKTIFGGLADRISSSAGADGVLTIGPLPHAIMVTVVDMPGFAQTRLPDVNLVEATDTVDGGAFTIQQPGTALTVDVVDGAGAGVPNHEVRIEKVRARSPLVLRPTRTDQRGRVTFERLAAGQYRVSSSAVDRCGNVSLVASRLLPVSGNGPVETSLIVGGHATFRITSPLGPARAFVISASPIGAGARPLGCRGVTDRDGRVTLTNFPPGPARVEVQMLNSTYVRQVNVPADGREMAIAIPEGLQPVHVVDEKNEPVADAAIAWTGGGGRVEARATATGDALLEGVGITGGTLNVSARGYQPAGEQLAETPGTTQTIVLTRLSRAAELRARVLVTTTAHEPLRDAVVALTSADPAVVARVSATDAKGVVMFTDLPPGFIQLTASADGFASATSRVASGAAGEVIFTLSRGYRAVADVDLPLAAGPQLVRVRDEVSGATIDLLDGDSDRRVEPHGRLSLGPLEPGAYVIELEGANGRSRAAVRIVDRDASVTFR